MKGKYKLFLLGIVGLAALFSFRSNSENRLSADDLAQLYGCFFEHPYEYMFYDKGESVTINDREYSMFGAGVNGILFYGSWKSCFGNFCNSKGWTAGNNLEKLGCVADMPVVLSEENGFDYINPAVVKWGHENLIPNPKDLLLNHAYQKLYDVIFSRYFRLMAASYLYLENYTDAKQERNDYLEATLQRGEYGIGYLNDRFQHIQQLREYEMREDGTAWTVPMSFGFWMRRDQDGSGDEVWTGLQKLMQAFDGKWLKKTMKELDGTPVKYDPPTSCQGCDCDVIVYVATNDGFPVYESRTDKSRVLLTVPPNDVEGCDAPFVSVQILKINGPWVKIAWASGCNNDVFEKGGWVKNLDLRVGTRGYSGGCPAFAKPDIRSPIFAEFSGESEGKVLSCSGAWLLYEQQANNNNAAIVGWLQPDDQCPNSVTTCP